MKKFILITGSAGFIGYHLINSINKKFKKKYLPMQKGDVFKTYSDIKKIQRIIKYQPKINIETGLKKFILWYREYYKINS